MKVRFANRDGFSFGVGKRNRFWAAKIESRRTNNSLGLQLVMPVEDGLSDDPEEQTTGSDIRILGDKDAKDRLRNSLEVAQRHRGSLR